MLVGEIFRSPHRPTYLPSSFSPASCSSTQPHVLLSDFCVQCPEDVIKDCV